MPASTRGPSSTLAAPPASRPSEGYALACVGGVVLFDDAAPLALIQSLRPDVLVEGADYTRETVVGGAFVESYGGRVALINLVEGKSTTGTITRMKA